VTCEEGAAATRPQAAVNISTPQQKPNLRFIEPLSRLIICTLVFFAVGRNAPNLSYKQLFLTAQIILIVSFSANCTFLGLPCAASSIG
jgi:hypothetical protein